MVVKIVKIFLGLSLVLWAVWVHFKGGFLCFSFFCLLVSSVSDFFPDTRRGGGGQLFFLFFSFFFFRLTCSVVLWGGRDAANK